MITQVMKKGDAEIVQVSTARTPDQAHAWAMLDADPMALTWQRVDASRRYGFIFAGIDTAP